MSCGPLLRRSRASGHIARDTAPIPRQVLCDLSMSTHHGERRAGMRVPSAVAAAASEETTAIISDAPVAFPRIEDMCVCVFVCVGMRHANAKKRKRLLAAPFSHSLSLGRARCLCPWDEGGSLIMMTTPTSNDCDGTRATRFAIP